MIYGSSTQDVLVKKITLKIWRLRDEILALVEKEVDAGTENLATIASTYKTEYKDKKKSSDQIKKVDDIETSKKKEDVEKNKLTGRVKEENIFYAKTLLSEITMDKMYFFSSEKFIIGQSIVIEFDIPRPFILNAEILYCHEFNMMSRVISEKKMPYRASACFTFVKKNEREYLRSFLKSIGPILKNKEKKADATASEPEQSNDSPENFDDLENIDI